MEVTKGLKEWPCSNHEIEPLLRKMEIENRQAYRSTTELYSFLLKVTRQDFLHKLKFELQLTKRGSITVKLFEKFN